LKVGLSVGLGGLLGTGLTVFASGEPASSGLDAKKLPPFQG